MSGIISAIKESATSAPAGPPDSRAMANPAQDAVSSVSGTAKATTSSEFSV